jgi:ariadne-1
MESLSKQGSERRENEPDEMEDAWGEAGLQLES